MLTRSSCVCLLVLAAGLPVTTTTLAAQDSILLRYQPRERLVARITSATDGEARVALGGLMQLFAALGEGLMEAFGDTTDVSARDSLDAMMEQAAADSLRIQISMQQYLTDQVLEATDGRRTVYRTADSTSLRVRAEGERWEQSEPGEFPRTSAEAVLDDRLQIVEFRLIDAGPEHEKLESFLRAPYGGLELTLPEEPLAPGEGWWTDLHFPMTLTEGLQPGVDEGPPTPDMQPPDLVSRARITLDSLVDRGLDTLAYLRLRGVFEPATYAADSAGVSGTVTMDGSIAGTLVWSTGWSTFISGTWRAGLTMEMDMELPGMEEPVGIGMWLDVTNRFQVRP